MNAYNLQGIFIAYFWFIFAVTIHRWGQALLARLLGDDTPFIDGRLTLNPFAHLSFIGTIIVPFCLFFCYPGFVVIGWGTPVVANINNFRRPKLGNIFYTVLSLSLNFIFGFLILLLGFILRNYGEFFQYLCMIGVSVNVAMGIFNLIPIPPLDGSRLMIIFLGIKKETFMTLSLVGLGLLVVLVNLPVFDQYFSFTYRFVFDQFLRVAQRLFY